MMMMMRAQKAARIWRARPTSSSSSFASFPSFSVAEREGRRRGKTAFSRYVDGGGVTLSFRTGDRRWMSLLGGRMKFVPKRTKQKATCSTGTTMNHRAVSTSERRIAYWLAGCAGMVGSMVLIGGLTRLTVSGLSMVDWKPQGSLPPITRAEWEAEFEKYKSYPQWKRSERDMTLSEFKYIYFWEWGHRMLGRATGLAFALPLAYFGATRQIPKWLWPRLFGMFALGGTQGLIGWWMVKSGLHEETLVHKYEVARVSPYRLATHLTLAFGLYSILTWTVMDLLRPFPSSLHFAAASDKTLTGPLRHLRNLRFSALGSGGLVIATVVAGAFVAGNDAGRAYNTFPLMNGEFFPSEGWKMSPWWRNVFENSALVQWNHRMLGLTTGGAIFSTLLYARSGSVWPLLGSTSRIAIGAFAGVAACQISLGITALLYYVPVEIGSAHQVGALTLWTTALVLAHSLRPARSALVHRVMRAKPPVG
eukprot:g1328.t1